MGFFSSNRVASHCTLLVYSFSNDLQAKNSHFEENKIESIKDVSFFFSIPFVLQFFKPEFLVVCIFADSLRNIPRIERPYAGHGRQAQSLQYKNFFQANASHAIMVSSSTQSLLISSLRKNPCQKAPLLKSLGLLLMHFSRSFPLH